MNDNLHKAKAAKNDEFYTQLSDIEKELSNYPADTFKNKIIYCPCDVGVDGLDIPKSNFVKYFEMNKERLGYKQLLHTSLQEGYDFHSTYCTRLLNEADIVVTNPPFSLFRDFFKWLMDNDKKFIIVGNQNAISYKEIFPYIKDNKVWMGTGKSYSGLAGYFVSPYDDYAVTGQHKEGQVRVSGVCWFTNVEHQRLHEPLLIIEKYSKDKYPKYDNYDAIEVSKTKDIPCDYDGVMGVPISFLHKYSPDQFEIVGWSRHNDENMDGGYWQGGENDATINGKSVYRRILIKRRGN